MGRISITSVLMGVMLFGALLGGIVSKSIGNSGSQPANDKKAKIEIESMIILRDVISVGNHSYISAGENMYGVLEDHAPLILNILNEFEKTHQELEITSWNVHWVPNKVHGLWVNHRKK